MCGAARLRSLGLYSTGNGLKSATIPLDPYYSRQMLGVWMQDQDSRTWVPLYVNCDHELNAMHTTIEMITVVDDSPCMYPSAFFLPSVGSRVLLH